MYSENENISGYCVDILEDGYPNGYVVVKFSDNDPVVSEFSLGENIRNPYAKIMERATTKYQYLRIADGWNDYLRYINFNGYDYTRKDGWSFSVSK